MVFLHRSSLSRKTPAAAAAAAAADAATTASAAEEGKQIRVATTEEMEQKMISILAESGCTLLNPNAPPTLPTDPHNFRRRLDSLFSNPSLLSDFLSGFDAFTRSPRCLRRLLLPSPPSRHSLVRLLLLVPPLQFHLQLLLLQKLPEHFQTDSLDDDDDDVARLILTQFRWLDFVVDSDGFVGKLIEVISICPFSLKKEIIGSLPEMIADQSNGIVVHSLLGLLEEDSEIVVPVLDALSNLNLDDQQQEQVVTVALSCIRTVDFEHMPFLLRFLMLSATPGNARRIISQVREHLKFVSVGDFHASRGKKLKGKTSGENAEGLILEALRSGLQFKNNLCQEVLKELKSLDKAQDHKAVDIWLLVLIYTNGGSLQKVVEKILKKKIMDDHLRESLFDQCIHGHREIEYFPSFRSLCEYLLACKEQKLRDFSVHLYTSLFKEFTDMYSRQEILGALVAHIGSGINYEVGSSLDTMVLLARKYADELLPLCSHINGILDYLEGFNLENLHKVYEVFSLLSLSARSNAKSVGSSIANELLMIVRKQVSNPDLKYKKMGLVGALKIVSYLGNISNVNSQASSQRNNYEHKNCEESLELLKASLESCKLLPLPSVLFHDELINLLESTSMHPTIMEWSLPSLQVLPAYFLLLSVVERLTNQGSLGGIDALLGCPLHLPAPKLNAFCTQVSGRVGCVSQATKGEIYGKLLKRLRNLVLMESLLNASLKLYPVPLPELNLFMEHSWPSSHGSKPKHGLMEKKRERPILPEKDSSRKKHKCSVPSGASATDKLKQPTILDMLKKAGVVSQEVPNGEPSSLSSSGKVSQPSVHDKCASNDPEIVEISAAASIFDAQKLKCRPLLIDCFSIFTFSELPLLLYLLRDLSSKLSYLIPQNKHVQAEFSRMAPGLGMMETSEFLCKTRQIFPSMKKQLNSSVHMLREAEETCEDHWESQSSIAGNPLIPDFVMKKSSVAGSVSKEVLSCFSKILNLAHLQRDISVLSALLEAFQPNCVPDILLSENKLVPGNIDYIYLGAFLFLEDVLETASSISIMLALDVICTLESVVISAQSYAELSNGHNKSIQVECVQKVIPLLCTRLGMSAQKLLMQNFNSEGHDDGWKSKGETIQKILHIYIENSESAGDLLEEFACSILPEVPSSRTRLTEEEAIHGYPTLCQSTLTVWCRVLYQRNLAVLNKLVKEASMLRRPWANAQVEPVKGLLTKLRQSVNVVVSLVNLCKTHDKVKELQKATRIMQTLCSEAKVSCGQLRAFHGKVWNLKHKDLLGQVVSSQLYANDDDEEEAEGGVDNSEATEQTMINDDQPNQPQ
ncbi:hypothetical protein Sjap_026416 [Stephania japonica]|uniref:Fanconi anemia group D2 protein n=1 Tax=Stephania japonica TaxID=461633 RepID=A0AAP0E3H1_9MAGN